MMAETSENMDDKPAVPLKQQYGTQSPSNCARHAVNGG